MKLKENFEQIKVSILFTQRDSIYDRMWGLDTWSVDRDARKWPGGNPIVAHPPCRGWGSMRHFARPGPGEKDLAFFALEQVRKYGGVLEHPRGSSFWKAAQLPRPGAGCDEFGGWTLQVKQYWWGHRAEKATWLYIVGAAPADIPAVPFRDGRPSHIVAQCCIRRDGSRIRKGHPKWRPKLEPREREATPPTFAEWLVELAQRCAS